MDMCERQLSHFSSLSAYHIDIFAIAIAFEAIRRIPSVLLPFFYWLLHMINSFGGMHTYLKE